jgi:hypothetical protein
VRGRRVMRRWGFEGGLTGSSPRWHVPLGQHGTAKDISHIIAMWKSMCNRPQAFTKLYARALGSQEQYHPWKQQHNAS